MTNNEFQTQIDVNLCWQFVLILGFHILLILTWQIIPRLDISPKFFYIVSFVSVLNFSINPLIYYIFNKKIRMGAATLAFGWIPGLTPGGTTAVHPMPPQEAVDGMPRVG